MREGVVAGNPASHATLLAESLPAAGRARLPVAGMSMAPLLLPGDEVEIESAGRGGPRSGEVILLAPRDRHGAVLGLVVHRLLRRTRRGLLVRGDGARSADPLWPEECAIAVVRARWRAGVRTEIAAGTGRRAPWRGLLAGRLPAPLRTLLSALARSRPTR